MARTLLVTNGDSAVERLRGAGIDGPVVAWRDALHDGPVPRTSDLESLSAVRARFIADALGFDHDEVRRTFAGRDAAMRRHGEFERIEIWLEHDLYDQLQLLQILDTFVALGRHDGLHLVQADDYLGLQPEAEILRLHACAAPVTPAQREIARRAWPASVRPIRASSRRCSMRISAPCPISGRPFSGSCPSCPTPSAACR